MQVSHWDAHDRICTNWYSYQMFVWQNSIFLFVFVLLLRSSSCTIRTKKKKFKFMFLFRTCRTMLLYVKDINFCTSNYPTVHQSNLLLKEDVPLMWAILYLSFMCITRVNCFMWAIHRTCLIFLKDTLIKVNNWQT